MDFLAYTSYGAIIGLISPVAKDTNQKEENDQEAKKKIIPRIRRKIVSRGTSSPTELGKRNPQANKWKTK